MYLSDIVAKNFGETDTKSSIIMNTMANLVVYDGVGRKGLFNKHKNFLIENKDIGQFFYRYISEINKAKYKHGDVDTFMHELYLKLFKIDIDISEHEKMLNSVMGISELDVINQKALDMLLIKLSKIEANYSSNIHVSFNDMLQKDPMNSILILQSIFICSRDLEFRFHDNQNHLAYINAKCKQDFSDPKSTVIKYIYASNGPYLINSSLLFRICRLLEVFISSFESAYNTGGLSNDECEIANDQLNQVAYAYIGKDYLASNPIYYEKPSSISKEAYSNRFVDLSVHNKVHRYFITNYIDNPNYKFLDFNKSSFKNQLLHCLENIPDFSDKFYIPMNIRKNHHSYKFIFNNDPVLYSELICEIAKDTNVFMSLRDYEELIISNEVLSESAISSLFKRAYDTYNNIIIVNMLDWSSLYNSTSMLNGKSTKELKFINGTSGTHTNMYEILRIFSNCPSLGNCPPLQANIFSLGIKEFRVNIATRSKVFKRGSRLGKHGWTTLQDIMLKTKCIDTLKELNANPNW
jgi:hypothetical protein